MFAGQPTVALYDDGVDSGRLSVVNGEGCFGLLGLLIAPPRRQIQRDQARQHGHGDDAERCG